MELTDEAEPVVADQKAGTDVAAESLERHETISTALTGDQLVLMLVQVQVG